MESEVLLFLKIINIVRILFYNFIEFIILLCIFLVSSFARYKEYIIYFISFSNFSDVLSTFTCGIGNLWSICLIVNALSCLQSDPLQLEALAAQAKIPGHPFPYVCFPFGNIPLSKILRTFIKIIRLHTLPSIKKYNCEFKS